MISMYNFEESTFQEQLVFSEFDEGDDTEPWYGTITEYLCNRRGVISIEPTRDSEKDVISLSSLLSKKKD